MNEEKPLPLPPARSTPSIGDLIEGIAEVAAPVLMLFGLFLLALPSSEPSPAPSVRCPGCGARIVLRG